MYTCDVCKHQTRYVIHNVDLLAVLCYPCQEVFSDWVEEMWTDDNPDFKFSDFTLDVLVRDE